MSSRNFTIMVAALVAGSVLPNQAPGQDRTQRRSNVLLIVSDNQRPDTIAALGNQHILTPNLDRLVHEGFVFNNAYFMGSTTGATCLPSRTMLMTGRTLFRVPLRRMSEEAEAANPITGIPVLPRTLKDGGYSTLRTGKMGNYPRFAAQEFHKNIVVARSVNGSARHADNAIEFLRSQQPGKPFFLYVAFAAPNDPHAGPGTAPKKYMDMYKAGDVPVPPNFMPIHPFDNGEMIIRDELLAPWPRTKETMERHLAGFYSVITYMDHQIGRILEALKQTGQYDNTIIIFAADPRSRLGRCIFWRDELNPPSESYVRFPAPLAGLPPRGVFTQGSASLHPWATIRRRFAARRLYPRMKASTADEGPYPRLKGSTWTVLVLASENPPP